MSAGQIYDLGYKRYVGDRRSVGTRWKVILRNQLSSAWKTWWRFKMWLIFALLATAVSGTLLYIFSNKTLAMFSGMAGGKVSLADSILPLSMSWYCPIGFGISMAIGASVVAGDMRSGAFTFYFARSLRPRDYVLGKLAGLAIVIGSVMFVGPLLLAGLRLGLSDSTANLLELVPVIGKAAVIGLLGTLVYTAVPLGFSALIANRGYAIAMWAVYYVVVGQMAAGISLATSPVVAVIDPAVALKALSYNLFDVRLPPFDIPGIAALISLLVQPAIAIGLVFWRVQRAQQSGVGGAS